jgi:hypothetical protein
MFSDTKRAVFPVSLSQGRIDTVPIYTRRVTIQMFWTCKTCGTKNPGLEGKEDESLRCSGCGNQKSDEPYEMPDDVQAAPEITDQRLLDLANADENWTCRFCRHQERNLHDQCSVCGAPRGERKRPARPPTEARIEVDDEVPPRKRFNGPLLIGISAGAIALAGIVWLFIWLFTPHEAVARIVASRWTRTENLLQRKTVDHEDWRDDLPEGSFDISCKRKKKGVKDCNPKKCDCKTEYKDCNCIGGEPEKCKCKTKRTCIDNGNGSATCDEEESCETCYTKKTCDKCPKEVCETCYEKCPVFDDWCTAKSHEWPVINTKTTSGSDLHPVWAGLVAVGNLQRIERTESYAIKLANGDRFWPYSPSSENEYIRLVGSKDGLRISYTNAGTVSILGIK